MKFAKFILNLTKNLAILGLIIIAGARIFFPKKFEDAIISPNRQMPVFGRVLGVTWDTAGDISDLITNKTVEIADDIETKDLNIDEKIEQINSSDNPKDEVKKIVEDSVQSKIEGYKDLPKDKVEEIKEEIRNQMYRQVCEDWLKEDNIENE